MIPPTIPSVAALDVMKRLAQEETGPDRWYSFYRDNPFCEKIVHEVLNCWENEIRKNYDSD